MLKLHGKNGSIAINDVPLTAKTDWTLQLARDYVDVTVYGDTGKTFYASLREVSGTFTGFLDADGDGAVAAAKSGAVVNVKVYADGTHLVASGSAYIDVAVSAAAIDAVRVSGSFKGTGGWSIT
jgi:hypothetical protein